MTELADLVTVSRRKDTITLWLVTEVPPAVRMTRAGKWGEPRAVAYNGWQKAWKERIRFAMTISGVEPLPGGVPLFFSCIFHYRRIPHNCDLDNLCKALLDCCQGVVFTGVDSWLDSIVADRIQSQVAGVSLTIGRL